MFKLWPCGERLCRERIGRRVRLRKRCFVFIPSSVRCSLMPSSLVRILLVVAALCGAQYASAAITVARIRGGGYRAANTVFSSGDLDGSITNLSIADFNSMTPAQLASTYDVLLFGWTGGDVSSINADWNTRLLPYLNAGGGVIFEQPDNLSDLLPAVAASEENFKSGSAIYDVSAAVPGLTDGISNLFFNSHIVFTAWSSELQPFLTAEKGGVSYVVGLYGEIGNNGGRIVLTGPDQDLHGVRGGAGSAGNQYNLLVNELRWVSSGVAANQAIPEPSTLFSVVGLLSTAALFSLRRRRRLCADAGEDLVDAG